MLLKSGMGVIVGTVPVAVGVMLGMTAEGVYRVDLCRELMFRSPLE